MNQPNVDMERVMARVRKMMAIANDSAASEGERDNAMRMAHATLAKYNLTLAQAEASGAQQTEARIKNDAVMSGHLWARIIANAIGTLFFCENFSTKVYGQPSKVKQWYVGRTANVATAIEMTQYVINSVIKEANRRRNELMADNTWHRSFCKGAANQIYWRCQQLRKEAERESAGASTGTSLVLASFYQTELEANQHFMEQQGITVRFSKSTERNTDGSAYRQGSDYGSSVNLSKQLGNSSANMRRLS